MATVNERLQSASIGHAVDLQHLSNAEVRKIIALLNSVDADLRKLLIDAIEKAGTNTYTAQRMNTVLASVLALNKAIYASIGEAMIEVVGELAAYEIGYQQALFTAVIPQQVLVTVSLNTVNLAQVREIAMSRPFQGRLLKEWMGDLEKDRAARIRNGIRIGMTEGQTTSQIVRRVMGLKEEGYADGLLNRSRKDIEAVVRTAISHTAQGARDAHYRANEDLIAEVSWLSTLDNRTSEECRVRDRLRYTNDTHQPIGHKVPWLSGPGRIHFCCRSTSTPIIKGWEELRLSKGLPESTRASMDGQVPRSTSYSEWLASQSAERQDEILGPTRGKLLREGGMKPGDFYNDKGKFLSLEELKARDGKAFEAAGLTKFKQPTGEFTVYDRGYPVSTPDTSTAARAKAVEIETAIRNDKLETGAFIDRNGRVLLQRQGEADNVGFPVDEFPRLKGTTFTHNHPGNSTFSAQDVQLASQIGLAELRAVGPTLRYSMIADQGWPGSDILDGAMIQSKNDAIKRVSGMVNRGDIEREFAQPESEHQFWTILSDKLGLKYTRERS